MKRAQPEAQLQKSVAVWLRVQHPKLLWWHVPNAARRSYREAQALLDMGMMPGIPDISIIFDTGRAGFIELKAPGGSLSGNQKAFRDAAVSRGAYWACCKSLEAVQGVIAVWLKDARDKKALRVG